MSSTNKVAIVTGAASGIGRSTALLLAGKGISVVAIDREREGAGTIEKLMRFEDLLPSVRFDGP